MIIDAHMHLTVESDGMENKKAALLRSMEADGADKGIIIADSTLESTIGSNEQCIELFEDDDRIRVVAGISPFIEYESRLALLDGWLRDKKAVGVKIFCGHEPVHIDSPSLEPVYAMAAEYGVPVLFHSGWDNPQYAAPEYVLGAAAAHPDVTLICCHCFYPEIEYCFDTLKSTPNVMFDVSSLADSPEYLDGFRPVLEDYINMMPERFIFGSDYNCCSRRAHIDFFASLRIGSRARDMFFCGSAGRVYGI